MKSNAEFDSAFRQKLGRHAEAPPPGMWDAIEAGLPPVKPKRKGLPLWFSLSAIVLFLTGGLIWFSVNTEQWSSSPVQITNPAGEIELSESAKNLSGSARTAEMPVPQSHAAADFRRPASEQSTLLERIKTASINPGPMPGSSVTSSATVATVDKGQISFATAKTEPSPEPIETSIVPDIGAAASPDAGTPSLEVGLEADSAMIDPAMTARAYSRFSRPYFLTGAFYLPEFGLAGNSLPGGANQSHGFGLRFGLEHRGFSIETGIARSRSVDTWDFSLDYLSRDSVGWYWDVVAVNFIPLINLQGDTIGYEPQFNTVQATTYDSIAHNYSEEIKGSYTYYHVPLLLGITRDFGGSQRLSYSIRGGAIYTRIDHKIALAPRFIKTDIRILSIDDGRYYRRTSNLQWVVASELRYNLISGLSIFTEPMLRFYREPYFLREDGVSLPKPVSFTLRTGLLYKF